MRDIACRKRHKLEQKRFAVGPAEPIALVGPNCIIVGRLIADGQHNRDEWRPSALERRSIPGQVLTRMHVAAEQVDDRVQRRAFAELLDKRKVSVSPSSIPTKTKSASGFP